MEFLNDFVIPNLPVKNEAGEIKGPGGNFNNYGDPSAMQM